MSFGRAGPVEVSLNVRGTDGFVRAGAACYTTADECDRLVSAVKELQRR